MKRSTTIDTQAFPAFRPFLVKAVKFAKASGGRFSKFDLQCAREWLKQRKWREEPPSLRIKYLIELFPVIFDYQNSVDVNDCDLERECAEAQRMIFREAVEKASVSTIRMIDNFQRDLSEEGIDWERALLKGESFSICASKLLNYRERYCGCSAISRTLATAMFVTDFGLWLGLPKVSCLKDEMLLKLFQIRASRMQTDSFSDESGCSSSNSTCSAESKRVTQRHLRKPIKSLRSEERDSSDKRRNSSSRRRRFFQRRSRDGQKQRLERRLERPEFPSARTSKWERSSTYDLL